MKTTKPFLFIDLSKSWREDLHPRDKFGKFSTVKAGSSVVTKTGKTGVVEKVTDSHYHVRTSEGKLSKVTKDNAIHSKDHKKVMEAQKKTKKAKASAKKANATKADKKLNQPKAKTIKQIAPKIKTAKQVQKEKVSAMTKKAKAENKAIREAKKKRDLEAPVLERNVDHVSNKKQKVQQAIPQNKTARREDVQASQNKASEEYTNLAQDRDTTNDIDNLWNSKAVQQLMKKDPSKRSASMVQKLAGMMAEGNDKLARSVVLKMGASRGLHLLNQVNIIQNDAEGKKHDGVDAYRQETGYYGDLLQSARATMYETLHNVMSGSQNPKEGTSIGAHVVNRIKQKLHRDIYDLMNTIPAPHAIRTAIGDMAKTERELSQMLGRTPTSEEMAHHMQANSKAFKEAPIVAPPRWDEKAGNWVATEKRISDPVERYRMLKTYADQQKTTTIDQNVGSEGEREVTLADSLKDTNASPEELYERKERQKELKTGIPKALNAMGLNDKEMKVFMYTFGSPSAKQNKGFMTMEEVANRINEEGGIDGKPISSSWVNKYMQSGMAKIKEARATNHPALQELAMFKSLFFNMIFKTMYEMDLVKSLSSWGVDLSILEQKHVRNATASNMYELRKSLQPNEYIGTVVTNDIGEIHARVIEFALPEDNQLYKSFNEFMTGLKKSMFPHKSANNSNYDLNKKATDYVKANSSKYQSMGNSQIARIKAKKGQLTWSEELQVKNGGVWITWGGKRILVNGTTGEVLYDSGNETHREEHNQGAQEDKIDFHHEKEELDEHEGAKEKEALEKWESEGKKKKGNFRTAFLKEHRLTENEDGSVAFNKHSEVNDDSSHLIDHGIQAFQEDMGKMQENWGKLKGSMKDELEHKTTMHYASMSPEEREAYDKLSKEEKVTATGKHMLENEFVKNRLAQFQEEAKGASEEEQKRLAEELAKDLGSHKDKGERHGFMALANKDKMIGGGKKLGGIAKTLVDNDLDSDEVANALGTAELSRAREEAGKNHIPKGVYLVGNPITGKTMAVKIDHDFVGGRGGRGGKLAPVISEAFDPEGGNHEIGRGEDGYLSWGDLSRALGFRNEKGNTADLKKLIIEQGNKSSTSPMLKELSEGEYNAQRANTKLGLQESMVHKDFKLVSQQRDKDGNITSQTFAQEMPDGSQNVLQVNKDGYIDDPIMARLIKQNKAIKDVNDLHDVLKNAVGNRAWVTANAGSDIHIGDALGHHVQLEYDGKGAPRVVSGTYEGYRFVDQADLPKDAIDPTTGEPVKALFKNGKLVDRKFTTKEAIPMKAGNEVLYPAGNGFRKGKIIGESEGGLIVKHADGTQAVYKKADLKNATKEGRTQSDSGQAVVKVGKTGTHHMNIEEAFAGAKPKARALFEEALRKAKVAGAFDSEGNVKKEIELSDTGMKKLQKILGRSKAGKEMLAKFNSAYSKDLEIHVPESMRAQLEAEGVKLSIGDSKLSRAKISASKFEQLRDALGGLSLDHEAREHLEDHFKRKDRTPKTREELEKNYQPATISDKTDFGKNYRSQWKESSYLMNPKQGLYGTQLEGLSHLVERGRAIAGHGMGTGKTILGVASALHYKAKKLANGEKPKKTLIVSPAGIQSDWGKEIGSHTNSKALYIGSASKLRKKDADGNWIKSDNGRHMFGQDGTEQEAVSTKSFLKNMGTHASEDHDFHIMSYDQFMKMRHHLTKSGMYDNIVIDEVHAFKNQTGQRGKSLAETTDSFKNVWGLSGTPMENDAREAYSLIDTVTGGRHELGTKKEFQDKFMLKDKNGKIVGVKPSMSDKLGDIMANIVQFRGGEDVTYNDGSKIHFPHLVGAPDKETGGNKPHDFIGNMVDRNHDHKTTDFYGTKHSTSDYETVSKEVTSKSGDTYTVQTTVPKNLPKAHQEMYNRYKELEGKYLPESKLAELATTSATGFEQGQKGKSNYLTGMQKLQKFLNAPLAEHMYTGAGKGNAIESEETDAQTVGGKKKAEGLKPYNPETGEGHYVVDNNGNKRYFKSDGKGGFEKNADGSPKLLDPLHHNNPKANYLKQRIGSYLDNLQKENEGRRKAGKPELMPKVVVKSAYTTFGTDIVDGVLKDLQNEHPHLHYWANKLASEGKQMGAGRFTGDADDREDTKLGFRGNKNDYANNQGHLWATTVSPAGKEGVDFGNAHYMVHFDQDWNPQKMAQFTARVRRSDSVKTHNQMGRDNSVRVESMHMAGTMEDFLFNAQDAKMDTIGQVVDSTREAEKAPKYGDSEAGIGYGSRGFTRGKKRKAGQKPKNPAKVSNVVDLPKPKAPQVDTSNLPKVAEKAFKLVILI